MSEGARANSIWLTCPLGHVRQWSSVGVRNGAAKWCSVAGSCGRPMRRLTADEEAACLVGGYEAASTLVARKFEIAQTMEIITRGDGLELWLCAHGHMTSFKPTSTIKWVCCPRRVDGWYKNDAELLSEFTCGSLILPATRAQVAAYLIGGEDAVVIL